MATSMTVTDVVPSPTVEPTLHLKLHDKSQGKPVATMAPMRYRKLKLDPLRALEPTRKKLSTIEAQRVMSVFEETIRRVELITLLPHVLANIDRFRISLGQELVELLEHHRRIQDSYEEIRDQLDHQLAKRLKSGKSHATDVGQSEEKVDKQEEKETDGEEHGEEKPGEEKPGEEEHSEEIPEEEAEGLARPASVASSGSMASIDSQTENTMRNLTFVAHQLSHSCKNILRLFSLNPSGMNTIIAEFKKREPDCKELCVDLHELKDILLNKLLTTPEEEKERVAYLEEISQRERNNAIIIGKMEGELNAAEEDKENAIHKMNDTIRHLQGDLYHIENFSEEHIKRVKIDAEKQANMETKNSDGKRQKLQQELNQLRTQLSNLTMENRDNEQELRKKKYKIESEVENWIQKYDQDMGERQDELEEVDAIYKEEKRQLNELEERFSTLEKEYLQIMEERREAREKRERAERELALMVKAATTIQAFWRSFKVRKALKSKKKKGGKKKKK